MKKKRLMLPSIVALAITMFIGQQIRVTHTNKANNLLMQNVEALSQSNDEPSLAEERRKCLDEGGQWNRASTCKESGFHDGTCKISGEITVFGFTLKGSYEKGKKYLIPWARYECVESAGNCCKKQGLYSGETKLA